MNNEMINENERLTDEALDDVSGGAVAKNSGNKVVTGYCPFCKTNRPIAVYSGTRGRCKTCKQPVEI